MSQTIALETKLAPLMPYLSDPLVTEIVMNQPEELWFLRQHQQYMHQVFMPELSYEWAMSLCQLIAFVAHQPLSQTSPLLSAAIPFNGTNYRVQIVLPPAVVGQSIALSIRKPSTRVFTLSDYEKQNAFAEINQYQHQLPESKKQLQHLFEQKNWPAFLSEAVSAKLNIMISAGTNTGKTTLLNALLNEMPAEERIITIEDSRELMPLQKNVVHLLYPRNTQSGAALNPVTLLESVLRLSPDRVLMGELRGAEAYTYLELLNSGHTGTITTLHADSPVSMFGRLSQMVMRFNPHYAGTDIVSYAKSLIHVVVQCQRDSQGKRSIAEIWCNDELFEH